MVFIAYNFIFYFLPIVLVIYYSMTWAGHLCGMTRQRLEVFTGCYMPDFQYTIGTS